MEVIKDNYHPAPDWKIKWQCYHCTSIFVVLFEDILNIEDRWCTSVQANVPYFETTNFQAVKCPCCSKLERIDLSPNLKQIIKNKPPIKIGEWM